MIPINEMPKQLQDELQKKGLLPLRIKFRRLWIECYLVDMENNYWGVKGNKK